jgi:hypothetical protein
MNVGRQRLPGVGLAFALVLGACASGGDDDDDDGEVLQPTPVPGWTRIKAKASCDRPNIWRLAPHFHLARDVDYVADRIGTEVISESGKACASASDQEDCKAQLATLPGEEETLLGHHLVTIEGSSVRLWNPQSALVVFGDIDTPAEAIWLVVTGGHNVDCGAAIYDTGHDGFGIAASFADMTCTGGRANVNVQVNARGVVAEGDPIADAGTPCAVPR